MRSQVFAWVAGIINYVVELEKIRRKMSSSNNAWQHWCPGGCGKRVYFVKGYAGGKRPYLCQVCKKRWSKEQMAEAN